ncbi:MAG: hypothetical protein ACM3MJ_02460 [Deltaproteobacteria bacterium]
MAADATRPTCYRIVLQGELGDDFQVLFEGLCLERAGGETSLTGKLDQAQLGGVIARMQDLGLELVSIEPLNGTQA